MPALVALIGAALIGLLVYGVSKQAASRTLDEDVKQGRFVPAPQAARRLPTLSGTGTSSLASYSGKVVVLNFWASWCGPCESEAPLLQSAQPQLLRHNATVLGVTYKDATSDSLGFVQQHHLTYPNLRDGSGEFAQAYGTDQLPESFLIDRSGRVVAISRGEIERSFVQRAIALAESS